MEINLDVEYRPGKAIRAVKLLLRLKTAKRAPISDQMPT